MLEIVSEEHGKVEYCNISYPTIDGARNNVTANLQHQPPFILQLESACKTEQLLADVHFESCKVPCREFKPKFIHAREVISNANNHWYRLAVRGPRTIGK